MTPDELLQVVTALQRIGMTFRAPEPDRWQPAWTDGKDPDLAPPDGFEPMGPWEPVGTGMEGSADCHIYCYFAWRRPLRAITTG